MPPPGKDVSTQVTCQLVGTNGFKPCVANGMVFTTGTISSGKSRFKIWKAAKAWTGFADKLLDLEIEGKLPHKFPFTPFRP